MQAGSTHGFMRSCGRFAARGVCPWLPTVTSCLCYILYISSVNSLLSRGIYSSTAVLSLPPLRTKGKSVSP
eukprot:scaffold97376_cov63-Phaeocystis_antarctica.AAC.4